MKTFKLLAFVSVLNVLLACSNQATREEDSNNNYFADALSCHQTALITTPVKVLTGNALTIVDMPSYYDDNAFASCMARNGHTPSSFTQDYLNSSRNCYLTARGKANANDLYAACMKNSQSAADPK